MTPHNNQQNLGNPSGSIKLRQNIARNPVICVGNRPSSLSPAPLSLASPSLPSPLPSPSHFPVPLSPSPLDDLFPLSLSLSLVFPRYALPSPLPSPLPLSFVYPRYAPSPSLFPSPFPLPCTPLFPLSLALSFPLSFVYPLLPSPLPSPSPLPCTPFSPLSFALLSPFVFPFLFSPFPLSSSSPFSLALPFPLSLALPFSPLLGSPFSLSLPLPPFPFSSPLPLSLPYFLTALSPLPCPPLFPPSSYFLTTLSPLLCAPLSLGLPPPHTPTRGAWPSPWPPPPHNPTRGAWPSPLASPPTPPPRTTPPPEERLARASLAYLCFVSLAASKPLVSSSRTLFRISLCPLLLGLLASKRPYRLLSKSRKEKAQNYKRVGWMRADTQTILSLHKRVVTHNNRISVTHDEPRTWNLHIRMVRENDRGCYMCQINTAVMKKTLGCIDVHVPPNIIDNETSSDVTVPDGESVTLVCAARGYPQPKIEWRREDKEKIWRSWRALTSTSPESTAARWEPTSASPRTKSRQLS
ncbi:hypothetical protein C7M84_012754 [Penaeus vannamei]|uniref:Ig-like domain-containing protein n=1 Tax=Penaeus vannamei TaxID=6689 RepID=A0A423SXZ8_PENVA|nr:hypothetical protein C7M84_012754 [Penaeus vannamei]